jgi:hypothetical protein
METDEVEMNAEAVRRQPMKPTIYIPSALAWLLLSPCGPGGVVLIAAA